MACADITTKESMARTDISTTEAMALADIASRKNIATAETLSAKLIAQNSVWANEQAAYIGLQANWYSSYNAIANGTSSTLTGIYTAWDNNWTRNQIAISEARARELMAVGATLRVNTNIATNN